MTRDETWVLHYDPEAKKQSMQWKYPDSPLLRNVRGFLQQGRWWPLYFRIIIALSRGLSWGSSHDKWCILCRRTRVAAPGDCKEKMKVDARCSALARSCTSLHLSLLWLLRLNAASRSFPILRILQIKPLRTIIVQIISLFPLESLSALWYLWKWSSVYTLEGVSSVANFITDNEESQ